MARNDEFNARNGTLSINQQTNSQREKTGERFNVNNKILGVGSLNASSLFSESPIGYDNDTNGLANREDGESVYETFSKVIDNDNEQNQGFGFSGIDYAVMNYNHKDNPFKEGNYDTLTTGEANEDIKAYKGFPDLNVNKDSINNPSLNQDQSPDSNISELPDGASYGSTASQYRDAMSSSANMLGRHVESQNGNGDPDTLGRYFTKNYIEGDL